MASINLTGALTHDGLIQLLAAEGLLSGEWDWLVFHVEPNAFLSTGAIGFLCSWGLHELAAGRRIEFRGPAAALGYLSRMDVFRHLGFQEFDESFERHPEAGRFIPVCLVANEDDVAGASNAICDLVLHQFDNAADFLPAMEWSVYEIVDNVRLHAQASVPGVVIAQYFPQRQRLDIAICDTGRGIMASLSEGDELWSHGDAVTTALQRGVTRDPEVGQGNGLAGSLQILRLNGGEFRLWTGDVDYCLKEGEENGFSELPEAPGTGVLLSLDTARPVRLEDTFMGDAGWSYITAEAERVQEAGGLRIIDSCVHTGGRETALPLRRKIEAMLPETDRPLILDFDGVRTASSSFLDELLGRLAAHIGAEQLRAQIRIVNAREAIRALSDVVIAQRLEA